MDDDLRALERRAAIDPDLQPLLRKARERAGLGRSLELRAVEAEEREAALEAAAGARARFREGRASHARALLVALRAWVAGAFTDFPGLEELTIDWRLHERRDGPWTVGLRVEVPVRDRPRPPQRRNRLAPEDARLLEGELLALAHLFPRRHDLFGGVRLSRDRDHDRVVVAPLPRGGDREGTTLQVPLRRVEELRAGLADTPLEAGRTLRIGERLDGARPLVRSRAGAALLLAGALADLADDDHELLARGGAAWDAFLTALFAEHRDLEVFAVRGWTSGYNDNWHDEHDQELCVTGPAMAYLAEDWGAPLPPEEAQALERAAASAGQEPGALPALRAALARELDESLFGDLLRLRHGHDWLLVVRRDGEHVVERLLLRPEAPPR